MEERKRSRLFRRWTIFLGQAAVNGATKEELDLLIKASGLIPKYEGYSAKKVKVEKGGDK